MPPHPSGGFKERTWGGLKQFAHGDSNPGLLWKYYPQQLTGRPAGEKTLVTKGPSHQRFIFGAVVTSYLRFFCPEYNFEAHLKIFLGVHFCCVCCVKGFHLLHL